MAAHFHFLHIVSIDYCFSDLIPDLGDSLSNFYLNWLLMMNLSSNSIRLYNCVLGFTTVGLPGAARAQTIIFLSPLRSTECGT
jgi:hypothetical protein